MLSQRDLELARNEEVLFTLGLLSQDFGWRGSDVDFLEINYLDGILYLEEKGYVERNGYSTRLIHDPLPHYSLTQNGLAFARRIKIL